MIEIRRGDIRDIPGVMAVMNTAFDPLFGEAWNNGQCTATLALPHTGLFLAHEEKEIVGFAINRWVLDEEELLMIGVSENHQNRAIGRLLIGNIAEAAIAAGRSKIFLEVRDGNTAQNFYQKLGFTIIGTRNNYYTGKDGQKYDAITMGLNLDVN